MANALLMALTKGKGKGPVASEDEAAPESTPEVGGDYKALAKSAAKDGDWDAMVDALCSYFEADQD